MRRRDVRGLVARPITVRAAYVRIASALLYSADPSWRLVRRCQLVTHAPHQGQGNPCYLRCPPPHQGGRGGGLARDPPPGQCCPTLVRSTGPARPAVRYARARAYCVEPRRTHRRLPYSVPRWKDARNNPWLMDPSDNGSDGPSCQRVQGPAYRQPPSHGWPQAVSRLEALGTWQLCYRGSTPQHQAGDGQWGKYGPGRLLRRSKSIPAAPSCTPLTPSQSRPTR